MKNIIVQGNFKQALIKHIVFLMQLSSLILIEGNIIKLLNSYEFILYISLQRP